MFYDHNDDVNNFSSLKVSYKSKVVAFSKKVVCKQTDIKA